MASYHKTKEDFGGLIVRSGKSMVTAEELLALPDTGFRYELVEGRLVKMPPAGAQHGAIATTLAFFLTTFVRCNDLGKVFAAETGFILARDPDTVRAPDVSFVASERLPEGGLPAHFLPLAPDLVAEVVSPSELKKYRRKFRTGWKLAFGLFGFFSLASER